MSDLDMVAVGEPDRQGDECGQNEADKPVAPQPVSATASIDDELWRARQREEMMFHGRMRSLELAVGVHMRRPKVKKGDEGTTITERIVSTAYVFYQFAIGAIDEAALLEDEDD